MAPYHPVSIQQYWIAILYYSIYWIVITVLSPGMIVLSPAAHRQADMQGHVHT